ncbi:MAG: hypothetical protein OEW68_16500 [Gammaproteobacteria bacterium]|nr:hypothetical protein [Gammaproteobacteria bacterium]
MTRTLLGQFRNFAATALIAGICSPANAVTLGQIDNFEDTTVQGWVEGAPSPNPPTNVAGGPPGSTRYLQDSSAGGVGAGSNMTLFNQSQWTGDFLSAGITRIRAMVRVDPGSDSALSLRVGFRSAAQAGARGYASLTPVVVPNDGNWYEVVFPIESTDLGQFNTGLSYASTMSNVGHMRIYHKTTAGWQGDDIVATMGIDNIEALESPTNYQGWLWGIGNYGYGSFGAEEEYCFGPFGLSLFPDLTWEGGTNDEVCWGRETFSDTRDFVNPPPFATESIDVRSTRPLQNAGGELHEWYGQEFIGGIGQGETRRGTVLGEPSGRDLLMIGAHQEFGSQFNPLSFSYLHLMVTSSDAVKAARTAADLIGTNWHVAVAGLTLNQTNVNSESANAGVLTLALQSGGVCTFSTSTVFPNVSKNRDLYVHVQTDNGDNLNNRGVLGGIPGAEFTNCTYAIDGDDYLAINTTLTLDSAPGTPTAIELRNVISDDNQYFVPAPASTGIDDNRKVLSVGYRSASGLTPAAIDGNYLFYMVLSEFAATGTFHSSGADGTQEFNTFGRGMFQFDSTTPGTVPAGETGTWNRCSASLVLDSFELEYEGSILSGTVLTLAEKFAEYANITRCDYRLDADGALLVHIVAVSPDEPDPFEATFRGYVNSSGELFSLAVAGTDPVNTGELVNVDGSSLFYLLGMNYTGNPYANEDADELTNLEEFQFPLASGPAVLPPCSSGSVQSVCGLPDLSGNGLGEVGVLLQDAVSGDWVVTIRDGSTDALVGSVNFGSEPAVSLEVIADLNSNGAEELALLSNRGSGQVAVVIRDSLSGAVLNTIFYGSSYVGRDLAVMPDTDGNGAPELVVLGVEAGGGIRAQARDALTDAETSTTFYGSNAEALDVQVIPDVSGNGEPEVLVHARVTASGQGRAQLRDSATGAFIRNIFFGNTYRPLQLVVIEDLSGDGIPDLAQLSRRDDTGAVRIQTKNAANGALIANAFTGNTDTPVSIIGIADANGNTVEDVAMLVEEPGGTGKIIVRDGGSGDFIRNIFVAGAGQPKGMAKVSDLNASGQAELAVLGNAAGQHKVQIKDSITGAQINNIDFP